MKVQINKVHFPVTALGPGQRLGIWFQGCSIGCKGCISRDTWPPKDSRDIDIEDLFQKCTSLTRGELDGITISGGEPFEQPEGLHRLVQRFVRWREAKRLHFDILCYSGMSMRRLRQKFPDTLSFIDALIAGPFVEDQAPGGAWAGSGGQQLVILSQIGNAIYTKQVLESAVARPTLQVSVDEQHIWYIGVPRPGDMRKLETAAARMGIDQSNVSWRP